MFERLMFGGVVALVLTLPTVAIAAITAFNIATYRPSCVPNEVEICTNTIPVWAIALTVLLFALNVIAWRMFWRMGQRPEEE